MNWKHAAAVLGAIGLMGALIAQAPCASAWVRWGFAADVCPAGTPRAALGVRGSLPQRGAAGGLRVEARALWRSADSPLTRTTPLSRGRPALTLVVGDAPQALPCEWARDHDAWSCAPTLPEDLPDGDHRLEVSWDGPLQPEPVTLDLPLYGPAVAHVLTDRPLYSPGDTVRFRALTLSAAGWVPAAARPGVWTVRDPSGQVVLEEPGTTDEWGVDTSSLPLSASAERGAWTVTWDSAGARAQATVRVEAIQLPGYTVEATPARPWFRRDEPVEVRLALRYRSGAPVADAAVTVQAEGTRAWPPPPSWTRPHTHRTDADGALTVTLPPAADLTDLARPILRVEATDAAGERVAKAVPLVLSVDPVQVEAVSAMDGLAEGWPNRVYLRLTSPDGQPLPDRDVTLTRRWDPRAPTLEARTDADGVAALELDPGAPVTVTLPEPPERAPRLETRPPVSVYSGYALTAARTTNVAELEQLEALAPHLGERCGVWIDQRDRALLTVATERGRVIRVTPGDGATSRCLGEALLGARLGEDTELYEVMLSLEPPRIPRLRADVKARAPTPVLAPIREALLAASPCVSASATSQPLETWLRWGLDGRTLDLEVVGDDAVAACLRRYMGRRTLPEDAGSDQGPVLLSVVAPEPPPADRVRVQTRPGWDFDVTVEGVGTGRWAPQPGTVPALRLRPSKAVVAPGEVFTVEALRGPDWRGDLPEWLTLTGPDRTTVRCPRTPSVTEDIPAACPAPDDTPAFRLQAPEQARGALVVAHGQVHVAVLVRADAAHTLRLSHRAEAYGPREMAVIDIDTQRPAVVSLTGVDEALGALAALPEPTELAEATLGAVSDQPAFPGLDALALATGQVRGDAAAAAILLRLSAEPPPLPPPVNVETEVAPPVDEARALAFYEQLAATRRAVRLWEAEARPGDKLDHAACAALWDEALARTGAADAFGVPLRLAELPDDLLAQAEPRRLVADAAWLPEDHEPWIPWVRRTQR